MNKIITEADLEIITETVEVYSIKYTLGHKYYDKQSAIYASITHNNCPKCNKLKDKFYSYCNECNNIIKQENYNNKPLLEEWNYPIYSDDFDKYFYDEDELSEFIEEYEFDNETKLNLLKCRFYPCKPNTLPELEYNDLDTDEDYALPEDIQLLLDKLNDIATNTVISYSPNFKYKIEIKDIQH